MMIQNKKNNLVVGAGIVLLLVASAMWYYKTHIDTAGDTLPSVVPLNEGNTTTTEGTNVLSVGGGASVKAPPLERAIPATSPDIDVATRASTLVFLKTSVDNLKDNPNSYQDWINVGLARQILGDYVGAEEVWLYSAKLAPSEPVAYANLGNLYMSYIKDGAKSELYFRNVITLSPQNTGTYRALAELYTYHYKKDTNAIELVLKEGIANNKKAYDLGVLLARYYKDHGDIAAAKSAFNVAAEAAASGGFVAIAASIREERDQLK